MVLPDKVAGPDFTLSFTARPDDAVGVATTSVFGAPGVNDCGEIEANAPIVCVARLGSPLTRMVL